MWVFNICIVTVPQSVDEADIWIIEVTWEQGSVLSSNPRPWQWHWLQTARDPPGATRSWAERHLKQLLTSLPVTDSCSASGSTIDMSNASNSTTCFCLSVMQKMICVTMDDNNADDEGKVWMGLGAGGQKMSLMSK